MGSIDIICQKQSQSNWCWKMLFEVLVYTALPLNQCPNCHHMGRFLNGLLLILLFAYVTSHDIGEWHPTLLRCSAQIRTWISSDRACACNAPLFITKTEADACLRVPFEGFPDASGWLLWRTGCRTQWTWSSQVLLMFLFEHVQNAFPSPQNNQNQPVHIKDEMGRPPA